MFNEVMLADDVTADSGKAAWPPFPGEKPSKQKLISWLDSWEDDLNTGGFAALLRDEIPFDCQKLKPRPLIPVPLDADPVRAASYAEKNAQIQYENDLKRDELDARVLECKTRLAAKLKKAFRPTAPLLLSRLLAAHAIVDVIDGVKLQVPDAYDGVAMFRDIKAMLNAREVSQYDLKTYCNAHKVVIRHIHTDNAKAHLSDEVTSLIRDDFKARYTTIAPDTPRSNGTMERQWRTMGEATVRLLSKANMPRNYAWYALRQAVDVRNTLPITDSPHECALSRFTGSKPSASHFRVWGCVVYAKVFHRVSKMADQAVRCVHLGRAPNQSGYLCFDPATKQMHVSVHCRFVETAVPGLTLSKQGWQDIVPEFADEYDPLQAPSDETVLVDQLESPLPLIQGGALQGGDIDLPPTQGGSSSKTVRFAQGGRTRGADGLGPNGGPALAHERPLRANVQYDAERQAQARKGVLARLVSVMTMALSPGGKAFGSQILNVGDVARGNFIIYLCSGPQRQGDFAHWIREISGTETYVVNIDKLRGGYEHDLSSQTVFEQLKALAGKRECVGVLASIPCGTWSPARFIPPGPPPLRDRSNPSGIPDSKGNLHLAVQQANAIARNVIAITDIAANHGAQFIFENPVDRGEGSQFAIAGREQHAPLWRLPEMIAFAKRRGNHTVQFDQCRVGASTQKTTQLLCSASVSEHVKKRLGPLVCNHPPGTHQPIVGKGPDDRFKTKESELFSSDLNRLLAESFLAPQDNHQSWLARIGAHITPYANTVTDKMMVASAALVASAKVDMDDPLSVAQCMSSMYLELDDSGQREAASIIRDAAPIVCSLLHPHSDPAVQVHAVAHADRNSDDNPSYKRAMSGPERQFWQDACDAEIEKFENHHIFVPVPEDSLPTWNSAKQRATEVVDMMWVLKKKYNELRELLKHKARGTIRGDQEVSADAQRGLEPEQTFAPTVRHNTLKLGIAAYTARAAKGPKLHRTHYRSFDVPEAFLRSNGTQDDGRQRHIRPPPGYRRYDRRGVPIVWKLTGNCYGRCAAPRIWYETIHGFLTGAVDMRQSDQDPCYYYKVYKDGTRLDLSLFVDDSWVCDDAGPNADADIKLICDKFNFTMPPDGGAGGAHRARAVRHV